MSNLMRIPGHSGQSFQSIPEPGEGDVGSEATCSIRKVGDVGSNAT